MLCHKLGIEVYFLLSDFFKLKHVKKINYFNMLSFWSICQTALYIKLATRSIFAATDKKKPAKEM